MQSTQACQGFSTQSQTSLTVIMYHTRWNLTNWLVFHCSMLIHISPILHFSRKLLSATLQVLCALCGEKGKAMLQRLDPRFLGVASRRVFSKSPSQSPIKSARLRSSSTMRTLLPAPPPKQLPSLNPVVVSDSKVNYLIHYTVLTHEAGSRLAWHHEKWQLVIFSKVPSGGC